MNRKSLKLCSIGPNLPKRLDGHQMLRIGHDLLVIGGNDNNGEHSGSLFTLSCHFNLCQWETLKEELEIPRAYFAAMVVPSDFVTCEN